jgi:hypothetical protein
MAGIPPRPNQNKGAAGQTNNPYMGVTIDGNQIHDALIITPDISTEMSKQAALFSRYAIAAVWARDKMERQKTALSILEADLDADARLTLTNRGDKVREASVEAIIHQDEKWQAANEKILEAKRELGILEAAAGAFQQRAMMLSGLGAIKRQEMEQELSSFTKNQAGKATQAVQNNFAKNAPKPGGGF